MMFVNSNLEINKGTLLANIEGNIIGNLNGNASTADHSLTCNTATNLADILPIVRGGTGLYNWYFWTNITSNK